VSELLLPYLKVLMVPLIAAHGTCDEFVYFCFATSVIPLGSGTLVRTTVDWDLTKILSILVLRSCSYDWEQDWCERTSYSSE